MRHPRTRMTGLSSHSCHVGIRRCRFPSDQPLPSAHPLPCTWISSRLNCMSSSSTISAMTVQYRKYVSSARLFESVVLRWPKTYKGTSYPALTPDFSATGICVLFAADLLSRAIQTKSSELLWCSGTPGISGLDRLQRVPLTLILY